MGNSTYTIRTVADVTSGEAIIQFPQQTGFEELLTDSRKLIHPEVSLFFALKGERHDGHRFIADLVAQGVRSFVVSDFSETWRSLDANFIVVKDTLIALQQLASFHRSHFQIPVIGITGSNGKTIVKEWLFQLLRPDMNIVRSPKSYNSQVGVPLSVWQMHDDHQLAIFEAGISRPGEMEHLSGIIRPTLGIFTNIGAAHDESFQSREQKIDEKLSLFAHVNRLIYCKDYSALHEAVQRRSLSGNEQECFTWSASCSAE